MLIRSSNSARETPTSSHIQELVKTVDANELQRWVETLSIPRHYIVQKSNNQFIAAWISNQFQSMGYSVERQGEFDNIVALPGAISGPHILVGAHYDSVPETPGADDNASAVAAMLGCAKVIANSGTRLPVVFVAFNREEDGLQGSADFVSNYIVKHKLFVQHAHILEMVGYARYEPKSQYLPEGLPIKIPDTGDFLAVLGNRHASESTDFVLSQARSYFPEFPVIALKIKLGIEKYFPVLLRSDHAPFWEQKISTVMWTDTSEFRNPNYHKVTDTPDSLDYEFMRRVTQLLSAVVLDQAGKL